MGAGGRSGTGGRRTASEASERHSDSAGRGGTGARLRGSGGRSQRADIFSAGNYLDAALSAAAMIPFAGWAATAGKGVKYAAKGADALTDALKYGDEAAAAVKGAARYGDEIGAAG